MDDVRPEQQEGGLVCCCRTPGSPSYSLVQPNLPSHLQTWQATTSKADSSSFWRSPGCATNTDGRLVHQLLVRQVVYADKRHTQLGGPNPRKEPRPERVTYPIRGLKQRDCSSSRLACDRGGHQHCSS